MKNGEFFLKKNIAATFTKSDIKSVATWMKKVDRIFYHIQKVNN